LELVDYLQPCEVLESGDEFCNLGVDGGHFGLGSVDVEMAEFDVLPLSHAAVVLGDHLPQLIIGLDYIL
jgi:hypothetical protein